MPDWLSEGSFTAYLILVVVGLCAALAWQRTRKKWLLGLIGIALIAAGALFSIDRAFESDREQLARKVNEMAAAVEPPRNMDKLFGNVSPDFRYGHIDKPAFREFCERAAAGRDVRELKIWDFVVGEVSRQRREAEASFRFKIEAVGVPSGAFYRCDARFRLDADNQWRLLTFKVYFLEGGDALSIPGLG